MQTSPTPRAPLRAAAARSRFGATVHWPRSLTPIAAAVLLAVATIACSPESGRVRGGGPGADIGNHAKTVQLHGQGIIYYQTPLVGNAIRAK